MSVKAHLDLSGELPSFLKSTAHIRQDPNWRVDPVPQRLRRRHVDIGDLAPCDTERFIQGLQSPAQGIQVPVTTKIIFVDWIYVSSFWAFKTLCIEPIIHRSLAANQMVAPVTKAVWFKCLFQGGTADWDRVGLEPLIFMSLNELLRPLQADPFELLGAFINLG